MNDTLCPRCGFPAGVKDVSVEIEDWPEGVPHPPLPDEIQPHPHGVCCSPYLIGDMVWWDLDQAALDLPPMKVFFKELLEIECPSFRLVSGQWVQEGVRRATIAKVRPVKSSLQPCHVAFVDDPDHEFEVRVDSLTAIDRWPVLEIA